MWQVGIDQGFPGSSAARICLQCRRPWFNSWVRKICWRRHRLPTPVFLGFHGVLAGKESACRAGEPQFNSWVRKILWRRDRIPTPVFLGFPCDSPNKEHACNAGDLGKIPGLGRSPGEGKSYPPQYSGLENSMDCIVHGVAKNWT